LARARIRLFPPSQIADIEWRMPGPPALIVNFMG